MTAIMRRFAHRRILRLTSEVYVSAVRLLATAVTNRLRPIEAVIGIGGGGLPPARRLGQLIDTAVYCIGARHNPSDAAYTQATGKVNVHTAALAVALGGRRLTGRVLLVDDICGSGATLKVVRRMLDGHLTSTATVHPVVLCRNLAADAHLDLWLWTVDDWVSFPWEPLALDESPVEYLRLPERVQPS
jgi:hypoxanthine phosphoribosyltransferase